VRFRDYGMRGGLRYYFSVLDARRIRWVRQHTPHECVPITVTRGKLADIVNGRGTRRTECEYCFRVLR
jgi:hypothetical protein